MYVFLSDFTLLLFAFLLSMYLDYIVHNQCCTSCGRQFGIQNTNWLTDCLRKIRRRVGEEVTTQLMLALVMLRLDYCNAVLASVRQSTLEPLQRVQNAAACLVYQLDVRDHVTPSLMVLHWLPIRCRIDFKLCMIMYGIHTLADARRISKTSSVRPAAQQHVLACDRLPAASMWLNGCEPSLENAPSRMPDLLHEIHCHLTSVLQPALPCSRNSPNRTY